jgi:hypothetical protein
MYSRIHPTTSAQRRALACRYARRHLPLLDRAARGRHRSARRAEHHRRRIASRCLMALEVRSWNHPIQ